ncbi:hypothetical protein [Streptomyces erythrochromogenes]|uniref:hypothetical protein n=1 Tax=Streptomyces erythrochromogenes TaxID=285574 RepID=UPI0038670998|nr:hypothetical protein OG364_39295 [Streptomyces erythrochromogenes]
MSSVTAMWDASSALSEVKYRRAAYSPYFAEARRRGSEQLLAFIGQQGWKGVGVAAAEPTPSRCG